MTFEEYEKLPLAINILVTDVVMKILSEGDMSKAIMIADHILGCPKCAKNYHRFLEKVLAQVELVRLEEIGRKMQAQYN